MKTPAAIPYLLPPEEAITPRPWMTEDGAEIGDRFEHWDPFTDIELIRTVEIDLDMVRAACGLDDGSAFILTASWYANRTRLAGDGVNTVLSGHGGLVRASVSLGVPGASAGGRLDLRTRLVLRHPGRRPAMISPRRVGATLWWDGMQVALEGGAARFPVTAADFTGDGRLPDAAAWALEWDPDDFETPVLGGLRLLINTDHSSLVQALTSGGGDVRAATIRSFVTFDVARSLVRGALASDRFVDDPEVFQDGSIGRMLFDLLSICWPGVPARALQARSVEDPSRLDAELQAHLKVLG